jgi:chromatin remodeling complex protein RSC6
MPKQVKKNPTEVAETTTPAVAVVAAATEPKATKPKAAKKVAEPKAVETKAVEVEVKVEATETAAAASTPAAVDDVEAALAAKSAEFSAKLGQLASLITTLKSEFKTMEKNWSKELKAAQKISSKKKRKSGNRAPSGFVKPALISDELAKFLEKPTGTQMARTDVTRQLNTYIRANSLQDKENGRKINPDAKLQALLKLKKTDELTYFNLQRYMSPHFPKAEAVVA